MLRFLQKNSAKLFTVASVLVVLQLFAGKAFGQAIVTFPTSWVGSPASVNATTVAPNIITPVTATRGSGLAAVSSTARFNGSGWQNASNPVLTVAGNNGYMTFSVTAATGFLLNLNGSTLTLSVASSGTGPTKYGIYTSVGGFASAAAQVSADLATSTGAPVSYNVTFPSSGYNGLSTIEIRLYGWGGSGAGGTGGFASMTLTGVVAASVPNTAPTFAVTSPTLTLCQDAAATSINSLIGVIDADASQTETWTTATSGAPAHGTLTYTTATHASGTGTLAPTGNVTYTPAAGYSGTDAFTIQVSDGAATATNTITVTVNPAPAAPATITGTATICAGATTALTETTTGGIWSSGNTAIVTVDATGNVAGVAGGTAAISYTVTNGTCNTSATSIVTVNTVPATPAAITGNAIVCAGSATTTLSNATSGGTWSSSNTTIATIANSASGVVTGLQPGTATITYTITNTCGSTPVTTVLTVNPLPSAGSITGGSSVGEGLSITLTDATTGGVWSSTNTTAAIIGSSTGAVTGLAIGTTTVSYTVTNSCGTVAATTNITVAGFGRGNLVVLTIGDGTGVLSNASAPLFAVEYTTSGAPTGINVALPTTTVSAVPITASGTGTEGNITLSAERDRIIVPGYAAVPGITNIASTTSIANPRELYAINMAGAATFADSSASAYSGNNIRSGTASGTNYFSAGGNATINGVVYMNTSTQIEPLNKAYNVQIFNGQLYFASQATSNIGIVQIGTGVSTAAGQTATVLASTSLTAPFGFSISPDGNTLYVADVTSGIGIRKFTRTGGTGPFAAAYTVNTTQVQGLTVDYSGANPIIYATTSTGASIIKVTDIGAGSASTTIATAATNTAFKGLTFAPSCFASIAALSSPICSGTTGSVVITGNPTATVTYNINGGTPLTTIIGANGFDTVSVGTLTAATTVTLVNIATGSASVPLSGSTIINITPLATAITGTAIVCEGGATTALSDATTGGTWSSGATATATVGSTGIVTGVAAGTATISYTTACGFVTSIVTVNPLPAAPAAITGIATVCAGGATTSLVETVTGGVWSSSPTTIATAGSISGTITGVAAGTATIIYTITNSCGNATTNTVVTVNPLPTAPAAISGTAVVCAGGATITLGETTTGGTWSSTNTAAATVDPTGMITGVATGTATISYTISNSCGNAAATKTVTVNPLPIVPVALTGTMTVCAGGATTSLAETTTGGAWSTTATTIATVGSTGTVTGVSGGTATISYTISNSCGNAAASAVVTVNPLPAAPAAITGTLTGCAGGVTSTLEETTTGGAWSSANTTIATVDATGVITTVGAGTATISYTMTNGCGGTAATAIVTVNPLPVAPITITGIATVCAGGATTALADLTTGGAWTSTNTANATVGSTGIVTGVALGTATISYTITNGCGSAAATMDVTVNSTPTAPPAITGVANVCTSATTALADVISGGVWSSTATATATVGSTGIVSGVAVGTATISYTLTSGCGVAAATTVITVNTIPDAPASISGTLTVCAAGATTSLVETTTGGVWSSTATTVATIGSTGTVAGVTGGTATISYTLTNSCGSNAATAIITVNPLPDAPAAITGILTVCAGGATIALTDLTTGGAWASTNTAAATVDVNGTVTGVAGGTTTISYTLTNACGGTAATAIITVNPVPAAPAVITGTATVCIGVTTALHDVTTGGVWSSAATATATVGSTGIVTGVTTGTATISYTLTNGCGSTAATATVTVNALPAAPASITGTLTICAAGATTTLAETTTGGVWRSTLTTVATIGSITGTVTGVAGGTATISYTVTNGCGSIAATAIMTINPLPAAPALITGTLTTCAGGGTTVLADVTTGGAWSSTNTATATVDAAGTTVTGVATGTTTISYTLTNGCGSTATTRVVTVITTPAIPASITGTATVCPAGITTTLADATTGGVWSSTVTTVATIGSTGIVTGVTTGTTTISYTVTNICASSASSVVVTVNTAPAAPSAIGGAFTVCPAGAATSLTDVTTGGAWSSTSAAIATVGSSGIVTGVTAGTATISYTLTSGCSTAATTIVTVNPFPNTGTITGTMVLSPGATVALSDAVTGGVWSSTNTAAATVSATGVVSGIANGLTLISYTTTNGCGTASTSALVTVMTSSASGTLYDEDFNGGTYSSPYTNPAIVENAHLTGSTWTTTGAFTTFAGASGASLALSNSGAASTTWTLTFNVNSGYAASISSFNFWRQHSATGYANWSLDVNGTPIGTGTNPTSGTLIGVTPVSNTISGLTGTVNVHLVLFPANGGGGTFRLDDFTLNGSVDLMPAPSIANNPANVTIPATSSAGFTVSGVAGATSYQWQRNTSGLSGGTWANISSASLDATGLYSGFATTTTTSANTLSLAGVPVGWNGYAYRVIVTGSGGNDTSGAALLTVTAGPCTGAPTAGIANPASSAFCGSGSTTLSLTGSSANTGIAYQWMSSPTGIPGSFTAIGGATSTVFTTPVLTSTTVYKAVATCTAFSLSDTSSLATVAINPLPVFTVTPAGGNVCSGGTGLNMTAAGTAATYVWSPSTSLSATTGASVIANPTTNIIYSVTGTTSLGCVATNTVSVTYNVTPVATIVAPTTVNACVGGAVTLLSASRGLAGPQTVSSGSISLDASGSSSTPPVTSSLIMSAVPAGATITSVSVSVDFTSSFLNDYIFNLVAPNGNILNLIKQEGVHGAGSYSATVLSSSGTTTLASAGTASSITGTFAADALPSVGAAGFVSNTTSWPSLYSVPDGTWTLVVNNPTTFTNSSTALTNWSLTINYTLPPITWAPVTNLFTDAAGTTAYTGTVKDTVYEKPLSAATIVYTATTNNGGCTSSGNVSVTVNAIPTTPPSITGAAAVCEGGATTSLTDATTGGTWSSTATATATVGSTGIVTSVAAGIATISYTIANTCGTAGTSIAVTVNSLPAPSAAITGTATVCAGGAITSLADVTTGGIWSSGNTAIATVGTTGMVTGVATGTAIISYTRSNGCGNTSATAIVTVNPLATAPAAIGGAGIVCPGATTSLTDATTGGTWSSANTTIATVGSTGTVSGVATGTASIVYTITNSCGNATANKIVTVNPLPTAPSAITGIASVCAGGATTSLADVTTGGSWSSNNTTAATVGSTGIITGVAAGTATISYTATNSCGIAAATAVITINPLATPASIGGVAAVCAGGSTTTLTDIVTGGTWTSNTTSIATVDATGIVRGLIAGTATITYTTANGCGSAFVTQIVTVNPLPLAVTGAAIICPGSTVALADLSTGGSWISANTVIATVSSGTGIVTGVAGGTATISYTLNNWYLTPDCEPLIPTCTPPVPEQ